jgi:iron complex outermembrane receptor protein
MIKFKHFGLALVAELAVVATLTSAHAQAPAPPPGPGEQGGQLQQITVTGYVVPHVGEGSQPVVSLDRDFVEKQGDQTVSDVISRLPQNSGAFTPAVNAGSSFSPGASEVNLYGLGVSSTLVLIDGKRQTLFPFPQNGFQGFTDLNSIPLAAVDRIEVLKDGASAVYGSDAIAGVINVILKDEYNGGDINAYWGISQRGDYEVYHVQATAGISQKLGENSKFNLLAAFDYFQNSPIDAVDRSYSSNVNHTLRSTRDLTDLRSFSPPNGNFIGQTTGDIFTVPPASTGPTLGPGNEIVNDPSFYNTVPGVQLIPREERYGVFVKATYQPLQYVQIYDEFAYQYNKELSSFTASPLTSTDFLTVPTSNPFNLTGQALDPRLRMLTAGQRKEESIDETVRNVAGIRLINLPKNWFVDASFLYAESDGHNHESNFLSKSKLQAALNGTLPGFEGQFFNPFVDQNINYGPNRAILNAVKINPDDHARTGLTQWSLTAGGELFDTCAGPVTAGFGAEYRSNEYIDYKDIDSRTGNVVAQGGSSNASGKDYDRAFYGELTIPILGGKWSFPGGRLFEIVLQERYDNYSSFGEAWKPKISARYKPFDDLTLRVSYSEGFRAPSVTELFGATISAFQFVTDPRVPPPPNGTFYEVNLLTASNPKLQPETGYSYYGGLLWTPGSLDPEHSWWGWANGFSAYVDWIEITKHNVIAQIPQAFVITENFLGTGFAGFVTRDSAGNILSVIDPLENLGAIRIDALDFGASYTSKEYSWGKIYAAIDASYLYHISQQNLPGGQVFDFTSTYTTPDFKAVGSLFYSKTVFGVDTFQTGFVVNYVDFEHDFNDFKTAGQTLAEFVAATGFTQVHTVGDWTTFDWQISYEFGKPAEITPETPKPGYDKEGKRIVGEKAITPKAEGPSSGWRKWIAGTKLVFGINNIFDTRPPFSDVTTGYDPQVTSAIQRFFYVSLEKKF